MAIPYWINYFFSITVWIRSWVCLVYLNFDASGTQSPFPFTQWWCKKEKNRNSFKIKYIESLVDFLYKFQVWKVLPSTETIIAKVYRLAIIGIYKLIWMFYVNRGIFPSILYFSLLFSVWLVLLCIKLFQNHCKPNYNLSLTIVHSTI